jgi:hypothetical protein
MNSAFTMLLYKPVSLAMKRARLIRGEFDTKFNKSSVIIISIGALTLALSIVIFVLLKKSGV